MIRYIRAEPASARPALFLDRDGVLNRRKVDDYVTEANEFEPMDIALEAAAAADAAGAALVVVTNQGCIGRGRASEAQVMAIHSLVVDQFARSGLFVDGIYTCPHHPLSPDPGQRMCNCRKPKPGLILAAARDLDLNLTDSILIGDQPSDIGAARAAGLAEDRALLVDQYSATELACAVRHAWGDRGRR